MKILHFQERTETVNETSEETAGRALLETVEKRVGVGKTAIVSGWHDVLKNILSNFSPYLKAGKLVTFQAVEEWEKAFFEDLFIAVTVPGKTCGLFIPPSVLRQMMYPEPSENKQHTTVKPQSDKGILLVSRCGDFNIVLNALFAMPPHSPAVDIYDNGSLMAGYLFDSIEACKEQLSGIMATYFQKSADEKHHRSA